MTTPVGPQKRFSGVMSAAIWRPRMMSSLAEMYSPPHFDRSASPINVVSGYPSDSNAVTRSLPQSATYTLPSTSTATSAGRLSSPVPEPDLPNLAKNVPSAPNFCTRSLRQSATYTLSWASTPTPQGMLNSPSPAPASPHLSSSRPSGLNLRMRLLSASATRTLS